MEGKFLKGLQAEKINAAASYVAAIISERKPEIGIVLGSGLGSIVESIGDPITIKYADIPGFPVSTALGHIGNLICGYLGGKCVLVMQGRIHYYEGCGMAATTFPIYVMKALGVKVLMVSNAAGGVNFDYRCGDLMIIRDQIDVQPNPLIGPNDDRLGERFPDMSHAYDRELIVKAEEIAAGKGIMLRKGVYLSDTGPSFETPAEYRFYRLIGADAVGMSTAAEVIAANHCSMRVFGMSVITNEAHDDYAEDYQNDGNDVLETANEAASRMTAIIKELISTL